MPTKMSASHLAEPSRSSSLLSARTDPSYGTVADDVHSAVQGPTQRGEGLTNRRRRQLPKPSITLVNEGSVARDHLASERTFLAYVRTSLAISSMGVALVQLFRISSVSSTDRDARRRQIFAEALGGALILTGLLTLFIGLSRFFSVQNALVAGKFPASRVVVVLPALLLFLAISVVFGLLLAFRTDT